MLYKVICRVYFTPVGLKRMGLSEYSRCWWWSCFVGLLGDKTFMAKYTDYMEEGWGFESKKCPLFSFLCDFS